MRIPIRKTVLAALIISGIGATILAKIAVSDTQSEAQGCTDASLRGGYGAGTSGLINPGDPNNNTIGNFVPFAEAVHFVFDGHGGLSGTSSADYGGSSFPVTFQGTYTVRPNCTGSLSVNTGSSGIVNRDLVIVDSGREVEFVSTDPGLVIAGSMKKQRPSQE